MQDKRNILLITGIVTNDHDPKMIPMLRFLLESTGRFRVRVTEEFKGATAKTLEGYDAILFDYDGKYSLEAPYIGLGAETEKVLYDYVQNGGGAIIYHSAALHGDPALPEEFDRLVGCCLDLYHGSRKSPKLELTVNVDTNAHEITRGSQKYWTTSQDDLFVNMKWIPDLPVTVLATVRDSAGDYTDPTRIQEHIRRDYAGMDMTKLPGLDEDVPVAWIHNYGKGRVFTVTIGHGPDTLRRPNFVGMLCRGAEWAASGEITIPYPDLQEEKRIRAWPYYLDMSVGDFAAMTSF